MRRCVLAVAACAAVLGFALAPAGAAPEEAPPALLGNPRADRITPTAILDAIKRDLASLPADARPHARYISLAELRNSGGSDRALVSARRAVAKLLNSLSWEPQIHVPADIMEPRGVLFRIDLRRIAWSAERWDTLTAPYPYGRPAGTAPEAVVGSAPRCVRGDWLVAAASEPAMYYRLLAPLAAPDAVASEADLERLLGVQTTSRLEGAVLRGGWVDGGSAVVRRNRVVERVEGAKGVLWRTYDFLPGNANGVVSDLPLGSAGPAASADPAFVRDASSLAFTLPNGLYGFLVVDRAGARLDAMPAALLAPGCDTVTAGASCLGCHSSGVHEKADTLTVRIRRSQAARTTVLSAVDRIYRPDALARAAAADRARYAAALSRADVGVTSPNEDEPIVAALRLYGAPLSLAQAAAELGLPDSDALLRAIGDRSGVVDRGGDGEKAARSLRRGTFESKFTVLGAGASNAGQPEAPPVDAQALLSDLARWDAATAAERRAVADVVAAKLPAFRFLRMETFSCGGQTHEVAVFRHDATSMEFVLIPVGRFMMGTTESEAASWDGDRRRYELSIETARRVLLTKPFLVARTECTEAAYDRVTVALATARRIAELPVVASWNDAAEFCRRAGLELPSEAEWEYACRAGTTTPYCCGSKYSDLEGYAWSRWSEATEFRAAGQGKPNAFGLYDVHGNAAELCADVFRVWSAEDAKDPLARGLGRQERVARGGDYSSLLSLMRCAARRVEAQERASPRTGFRPVFRVKWD